MNKRFALPALLAACVIACHPKTDSAGCAIRGPDELMPEVVKRVHLGMTQGELESVMGQADYSPAEGQFYFSTGGECPLDDSDRLAPCGLVAEFRDHSSEDDGVLTDSLRSCWWGAIGE